MDTDSDQQVRELWHENCTTCDMYLSLTIDEEKKIMAGWVNVWYIGNALIYMEECVYKTCELKNVELPPYFPGRHWLRGLMDIWMKLFPESNSSIYRQICADVFTILSHHQYFVDFESSNIVELQQYLIDNYETVLNAFVRIAKNMNDNTTAECIRIGKWSERPEEDGSHIFYVCKKPFCKTSGPQTELQKRWNKFPSELCHIINPYGPTELESADHRKVLESKTLGARPKAPPGPTGKLKKIEMKRKINTVL